MPQPRFATDTTVEEEEGGAAPGRLSRGHSGIDGPGGGFAGLRSERGIAIAPINMLRIPRFLIGSILWLIAQPADAAPAYKILLDEKEPLRATIAVSLGDGRSHPIGLRARNEGRERLLAPPHCDRGTIRQANANLWLVPSECSEVRWHVRLDDYDSEGGDAAYPVALWSSRLRLWIVTNRLPWLTSNELDAKGQVRAIARRSSGERIEETFEGPRHGRPPFYAIVSTERPKLFRSRGLTLAMHGETPPAVTRDLQKKLVRIWARWARDLVPDGVARPERLDVAWMLPPPNPTDYGFFASAGQSGIVMQAVPKKGEIDAGKFAAAYVLIGGHEGFHSLIGSMPQTWPAWVNESWASHFAYRAAQEHLDAQGRAAAGALIGEKHDLSLLEGQEKYDRGDGNQSSLFYSKGARFWSAIEAVLISRDGASGRLAALIKDTRGFAGVDWARPDSLAAFLDARSNGRAGPVVRCYLETPACG